MLSMIQGEVVTRYDWVSSQEFTDIAVSYTHLLIKEEAIEHVRKIAERERAPMYVVGETTGDVYKRQTGEMLSMPSAIGAQTRLRCV